MSRTKKTKRSLRATDAKRQQMFDAFLSSAKDTSAWASSGNPIKKRIARLEIVWRDGLELMLHDIQTMFANFGVMSAGIDSVDMNVAALRAVLIDKGLITEEEFQTKRAGVVALVERMRREKEEELRQAEADEAKARALKEEEDRAISDAIRDQAGDGSTVDPELLKMKRAAESTVDDDHIPESAFRFGGS